MHCGKEPGRIVLAIIQVPTGRSVFKTLYMAVLLAGFALLMGSSPKLESLSRSQKQSATLIQKRTQI